MSGRYNEKAHQIISLAHQEACKLGNRLTDCDHLLLALCSQERELFRPFVAVSDLEEICERLKRHRGEDREIPPSAEPSLNACAKEALRYAEEESRRLGHDHVGSEHLLLGLLLEGNSFGAWLVQRKGLSPEGIRGILDRSGETVALRVKPDERAVKLAWLVVGVSIVVLALSLRSFWGRGSGKGTP